ncbi:MAG TPA: sister chromatid cohesion protein PDS5 [Elusimicrobiota bacterium]|nr:sister chromatid cohesion protein PDS5 [Elusimicrobiota bacterium]
MKYFLLVVALAVASFFAYQEMKPPPPPPPAPVIPAVPPCIVDNANLAKVIHAADDDNKDVRLQSLEFLDANWCDTQAQQVIFNKLNKDDSPEIRAKIAEQILAKHQGHDVSQNLIWALRDPDASVRVAVLKALAQVGDYSTAPNVTTALKDPDETVRLQALKTLTTLQNLEKEQIEAEQEAARRKAQEAAQKKQELGAGLW